MATGPHTVRASPDLELDALLEILCREVTEQILGEREAAAEPVKKNREAAR